MARLRNRLALLITIAAVPALAAAGMAAKDPAVYASIDIDRIGPAALLELRSTLAPAWTVEADDRLLVLSTRASLASLKRKYSVLDVVPNAEKLYVIRDAHDSVLRELDADVLVKGGRQAVVQARTARLETKDEHHPVLPFVPDQVLARQAANDAEPSKAVAFSEDVERLVEQVDGDRWHADLTELVRHNRYTHGSGIAQARDWIATKLADVPGLEVTTESFRVGSTVAYNVVAKLTGTSRPDDWYIVGAHYDATSQSPASAAPGAEDNGSGTAGMMEMARVLAASRPAATIFFIAYSGEEQGLDGSYAHVQKLVAEGDKSKVKAVLTMDMIAYTGDEDLDCLLESDERGGAALFDLLKAAAQRFTTLRMVTSLNPWGSDHVPYLEEGIPSLLTIENDWDSYPQYHRTTDRIENTRTELAVQTLRMQVAALAQLTLLGE